MRKKTLDRLNQLRDMTTQLATIANLPDPATSAGVPDTPVLSIDQRVELVMGQNYPRLDNGQQWPMSNNALYFSGRALDQRMTLMESASATQQQLIATQQQVIATQQQLMVQLLAGTSSTSDKVVALAARIELIQAAGQATQAQLEATIAGTLLAAARLTKVENQLRADELADVARDAHLANLDAQLEAQRLRAVAGEGASAEIRAAAAAASALAVAAQARADQAINAAAAAQRMADADALAASQAQTTATSAQQAAAANAATLATVQADLLLRLPSSMVQRFIAPTPSLTVQVGTAATFTITLPKPFSDNAYLVFFTKATGSALLNVQLSDTTKLPDRFTGTMQQTGVASLLVAPSSAEVLVFHL